MPELIKMYIRQSAIGFGISAVFVASLLYLNVANLWHLVTHTDVGVLAVVLLWVFNGIVFAGVQFGVAIMLLKPEDDRHGGTPHGLEPVPVRVPAGKTPKISGQ